MYTIEYYIGDVTLAITVETAAQALAKAEDLDRPDQQVRIICPNGDARDLIRFRDRVTSGPPGPNET